MPPRTATTADLQAALPPRNDASRRIRSKLDWAIVVSLLSMAALNLYMMADQIGATKAYAAPAAAPATHACGAPLA